MKKEMSGLSKAIKNARKKWHFGKGFKGIRKTGSDGGSFSDMEEMSSASESRLGRDGKMHTRSKN